MKHVWNKKDLNEHFTISSEEYEMIDKKQSSRKLIFAVFLKFHQYEGKFPDNKVDIPRVVISFIAKQLNISISNFYDYEWRDRTIKRYKIQILDYFGFKKWNSRYSNDLIDWIQTNILPGQFKDEHIKTSVLKHLYDIKIEPPKPIILQRIINSAVKGWETNIFKQISERLSDSAKAEIDRFLCNNPSNLNNSKESNDDDDNVLFRQLKSDTGNISLNSVIEETQKLESIRKVNLPQNLFNGIPHKFLQRYRDRVMTEPAREMRRHPLYIRYPLFAIFLYLRSREITDGLIDLLKQLIHRIGANAEKNVTKEMVEDFKNVKKVKNKDKLLFTMASEAWDYPDAPAKERIIPAVGENTIQSIIREYQLTGTPYNLKVNTRMRASYSNHYRRMLPLILKTLEFKSNNQEHQPIIDAIQILKKYIDSNLKYYPINENNPTDKIVPAVWENLVFEIDRTDKRKINRITYELCVLERLCEKLRCKEIWVVGADKYRNPDEDVPSDFEHNRFQYYKDLQLPINVEEFITKLQKEMDTALEALDKNIPSNPDVEILKKKNKSWIKLSPLDAQVEPKNLERLKSAIRKQWNIVSLLDILKEADFRINFTKHFKSLAQREIIDWNTLQKRLLLDLYAMGTNTGIKRIIAGDHGEKYEDLLYVKRRFITKEHLRQAIVSIVMQF